MILHAHVGGVANHLNVRRELGHHERIPANVGQIDQLLVVDDLALGGRGRLDQGRLSGDADTFRHVADFQLQVDCELVLRLKNDALPLDFLETLRLHRHRVRARSYLAKDILTGVVRGRGALDSGAFVDEGHSRVGDNSR